MKLFVLRLSGAVAAAESHDQGRRRPSIGESLQVIVDRHPVFFILHHRLHSGPVSDITKGTVPLPGVGSALPTRRSSRGSRRRRSQQEAANGGLNNVRQSFAKAPPPPDRHHVTTTSANQAIRVKILFYSFFYKNILH